MESFDITQPFKLIEVVLTITGLWNIEKSWTALQVLHFVSISGVFTFGFFISMVINLSHAQKMEQITEGLYMTLAMGLLVVREINFIIRREKFMELLKKLRLPEVAPKTKEEVVLFQKTFRSFERISRSFIALIWGIISAGCLYSILSEKQSLAFPAWYPFDWRNGNNHYWIAFTYQTLASLCSGLLYMQFDLLQGYLFFQVSIYYRLLCLRLQVIGHAHLTNGLLGNRKAALDDLKQCIQMHQFINRLAKTLQDIFSVPLFVKITVSAIIICLTGFQLAMLSPIKDKGLFFFNLFYLGGVLIQIMLPCYYGSQIEMESDLISLAVYSTNWTEMSLEYKQLMFCFMESLKQPTVILSGRYFRLRLITMGSVLQNAYSLFALLMNFKN